jgi:Undecaprenyl-phosphate glucose phosphotransferase
MLNPLTSGSLDRRNSAEFAGKMLTADNTLENSRPISGFFILTSLRAFDIFIQLILMSTSSFWYAMAGSGISTGASMMALAMAAIVVCATLGWLRTYEMPSLKLGLQTRNMILALIFGAIALFLCTTIISDGRSPSAIWPISFFTLSLVPLATARFIILALVQQWQAQGKLGTRTAVLGITDATAALLEALGPDPAEGVKVVGVYDDNWPTDVSRITPLRYLGDVEQLIADVRRNRIDAIIIGHPAHEADVMLRKYWQLRNVVAGVFLAPDPAEMHHSKVESFGKIGLRVIVSRPYSDWQALQKAVFDRGMAALLLLLMAPFLALLAILIVLDSPGPLLFRQPRIGLNNLPFICLKFRTMYHHMADPLADRQTTRNDERVTRIGRWLRRMSFDELPQLINVLRGEMSLVGPRPHAPNSRAGGCLFPDAVEEYPQRHRVKPGITGWAQVNGWRGETTSVNQIVQRVRCDLYYIDNWSIWLDIRILWLTALRALRDPQAF